MKSGNFKSKGLTLLPTHKFDGGKTYHMVEISPNLTKQEIENSLAELQKYIWLSELAPSQKLCLLALAHFNKGGIVDEVSVQAKIAYLTGLSENSVRLIFLALRKRSILTYLGRPNPIEGSRYRINTEALKTLQPFEGKNSISAELRHNIRNLLLRKHNLTCAYCCLKGNENKGADGRDWTIDRIIPGSKGGRYTPDNVTLSCFSCNSKKRTKLLGKGKIA